MADIATLKRGEGGFTCEFLQMLKKYLIDLSVPNFNVTDCRYVCLACDNLLTTSLLKVVKKREAN